MGRQNHQGGPLTVRSNGARSPRFLVVGLVAPSIAALALATHPISAAAMAATAATLTVNTCDEAHLDAAVTQANSDSAGDTVMFTCSGDIVLTRTLTITGSMTLDGSGQSVTLDGGDSVEVLRVNGGATLRLDALTVAHGSAAIGGGLYNDGTVSISNSTFASNSTHNPAETSFSGGGGLYNDGTMSISNSTFANNSTHIQTDNYYFNYGAGLSNDGSMSISNSTFDHNVVEFGDGGGLSNSGTVSISNSRFDNNVVDVDGYGAGLYSGAGTVSISNSTFASNSAGTYSFGGGLWSDSGTLSISNSTFTRNDAHIVGGLSASGTVSISNSTVTSNGADDGAIALGGTVSITNSTIAGNYSNTQAIGLDGTVSISNSTFADNYSAYDSAIGLGGTVSISNSTIADNHSGYSGTLDGTGTIRGSIVANNQGGNCQGSFTDAGYNLESGTDCGFTGTGSLQNTDPKLVASGLQSNGGPTPTIGLASDSPAIDRIPAASCPATDQRGVTRPDAGETACDIGAFESTQISDLVNLVAGLHLTTGLQTALDAKLNDALSADAAGQTAIACGDLTAFINQVEAQTGKGITTSQAAQLIGEARQLKALLAC